MKVTNQCPKCGSDDILRIEGYTGSYGAGNNVRTGLSIFSAVNVHRYLCCNCGFSEEWIDQEDIHIVEEYYRRH